MSSTANRSLDGSVQLEHDNDNDNYEDRGDGRKDENYDENDHEFDYSEYEQSLTGTECFYHDTDESEEDQTIGSEDQTIESRCLIAIGVPDDGDDSDSGSSKELKHASENQQQKQPSRDHQKRPPPTLGTASDERVAIIIAREEYNTKMRIKEERAATGCLRPKPSRTMNANANANANALAATTVAIAAAGTRSAAGVVSSATQTQTRADRERQEKMRTFEARQGGAVRRTVRRAFTRTRSARSSTSENMLNDGKSSSSSSSGSSGSGEKKTNSSKQNENEKVEMAKKKTPPPPIGASSYNSCGAASSPSSARSQRSISSGIDLDDKTRQRILSRSNLRRGQPRRPLNNNSSSLRNTRNRNTASSTATNTDTATDTTADTATSLSVGTGRRRPSDDKRNLRISPRMTASSLMAGSTRNNSSSRSSNNNNNNSAQLPSPTPAAASRPSDEKAAFRRRRNPRRASDAIAVEPAASANAINREETVRGTGTGTGSNISNLGVDVALESAIAHMANTNNIDDDDDGSEQHGGLEVTIVDDEEPEILPGAFAVSGIGDDEEGEGVSGYDSGFEDDADDSLMEQTMHSDNTNTEDGTEGGEDSQNQQRPPLLDGDLEAAVETTSSALDATSSAVVTSNYFVAELYEVEAAVTAVTAKILVTKEEDPITQGKIRKLSVQMSCGLLAMLVVAAIVIGVVVPKVVGRQNDDIDGSIERSAPVIEGWRPIGDVLTVEELFKDNIRFGNSVAISANGNRVAVGLPGADNPADDSLKSTGGVQIFDLVNGTEWEKTKFEIFGEYSNAELGTNVALSDDGTRVAIGAPSYSSDETGYVSIYEESNSTGVWALAGNFSGGSNATEGGVFGDAVGFSGDGRVIAIGDKKFDSFGLEDKGVVEIYQEINGTWNQMGTSLLGSKKRDQFGWSVALSKDGKRVAASSLGDTKEPGNVKIFDFNGTAWEGIGSSLIGESIREAFGFSVELSRDGSVVAASATGYSRDGQEASVGIVRTYRYDREKEEWSLYGQPLEGENEFDAFGSSIALSHDGDTVAIGGPDNGYFCDDCGHVKVFRNTGGTWNSSGSALGKSGIEKGQFGYDVALSATGNRLVGAAPFTTFNGFVSKVGQVFVFDSIVEDADS